MDREELVRRFANKNGAVFAGAGLSMGVGKGLFPSWAELVEPLRKKLEIDPGHAAAPEQIAGWFEAMYDRPQLVKHFEASLPEIEKTSRCHELVASLPVDVYFTTNFDNLLENALWKNPADRQGRILIKDTDFADYPGEGPMLVKLHGDLRNADYLVATRHDYDRYLDNRPGIVEMMRLMLMSRTVLFIGYSFNDHDLRLILSQVGTRMGKLRRPMYATQINPTPYVIAELKRYGVEVIPLRVPPNQPATPALEEWLSGFCYDVRQRRNAILQVGAADATSRLPEPPPCFIGRKDEIAMIQRHLTNCRLVTVYGPPGVGKSALAKYIAYEWAFDNKKHFDKTDLLFAYVVYVDARDCHDNDALQEKVLNDVASFLAVTSILQKSAANVAEKTAQVEALLNIYRMLIIVDHIDGLGPENAPGFWKWASHIPEPSRLLIVTQRKSFDFSLSIQVGPFSPGEARAFLDYHATARNKALDEAQIATILKLSGGAADGIMLLLRHFEVDMLPPHLQPGFTHDGPLSNDQLLEASWDLASADARAVLMAACVFNGKTISRKALQAGADMGGDDNRFDAAVGECERLFLLSKRTSVSTTGQVRIEHCLAPYTAALGEAKLLQTGQWGTDLQRRVAEYYAGYVRSCMVRPNPGVPYWNALASPGMQEVDNDWPKLHRILEWSKEHDRDLLVRLVFLLVHYMDTRLKNHERQRYAGAAIEYLDKIGRSAEEALLRIDALGWTLIEERRFDDAKWQIERGLQLLGAVGDEVRQDLVPLGNTWLARAYAEQNDMDTARTYIAEAQRHLSDARPWIACRVHMVGGDICFKEGDFKAALALYQDGQRLSSSYGGEEEYQWLPRLGMAYLRSGRLNDAESTFRRLLRVSDEDRIAIGTLYAKYGLAQLRYERDPSLRAHVAGQMDQIRIQLARSTSSHVLLTLLDGADCLTDTGKPAGS